MRHHLAPQTLTQMPPPLSQLKVVFLARGLVERAWSAMVIELRDRNPDNAPYAVTCQARPQDAEFVVKFTQ